MSNLTDEQHWVEFKAKHKKSYSDEEDAERFQIFQTNLRKVEEHNAKHAKGEVTFTMGINQFSDLKPEEMKSRCGVRRPEKNE